MPDTGPPWNLVYPSDTALVRDAPEQFEDLADSVVLGLNEASSNATLLTSGTVAAARLPFQFQTGVVSGNVSLQSISNTTVTFASGRFSTAPEVIVGHGRSYDDSSGGSPVYAAAVSITSTGFTMFRSNDSGGTRNITGRWVAIAGAA
jgi:hypothetical protein